MSKSSFTIFSFFASLALIVILGGFTVVNDAFSLETAKNEVAKKTLYITKYVDEGFTNITNNNKNSNAPSNKQVKASTNHNDDKIVTALKKSQVIIPMGKPTQDLVKNKKPKAKKVTAKIKAKPQPETATNDFANITPIVKPANSNKNKNKANKVNKVDDFSNMTPIFKPTSTNTARKTNDEFASITPIARPANKGKESASTKTHKIDTAKYNKILAFNYIAEPKLKPKNLQNIKKSSRTNIIPAIFSSDWFDDRKTVQDKSNANKSGGLIWPVIESAKQHISSKFGMRRNPVTRKRRMHKGVDIAAARGTKVLASSSGIVKTAKRSASYGKYIEIRHDNNNTNTIYAHLSRISVKSGQKISAGDVIGKVGSTGRSTGSHLHFEVLVGKNMKAKDPLKHVKLPAKMKLAKRKSNKKLKVSSLK